MAGSGNLFRGVLRPGSNPQRVTGGRSAAGVGSSLTETADFGPNPGALRMLTYAPPSLSAHAPLVVVLHGCTQTAEGYDAAAGWTRLAAQEGFAVLYPEQQRSNNPQGCFNWFLPADSARGLGESRSIRGMIDAAIERYDSDPARVFVTGLSAGGAMASALLADYPDLFAGGAVIAGLPCGAAASMGEAFEAMARPRDKTPAQLGDLVRARSVHAGPWPRISIWHGGADSTVVPKNADALVKQWTDVHGAPLEDFREEAAGPLRRRVWSVDGREIVELNLVPGMGHGTPLDAAAGEPKAPFMLDVGLSSTRRIAAFWGLTRHDMALARKPAERVPAPRVDARESARPRAADARDGARRSGPAVGGTDIGAVISRALKAAGLMR